MKILKRGYDFAMNELNNKNIKTNGLIYLISEIVVLRKLVKYCYNCFSPKNSFEKYVLSILL